MMTVSVMRAVIRGEQQQQQRQQQQQQQVAAVRQAADWFEECEGRGVRGSSMIQMLAPVRKPSIRTFVLGCWGVGASENRAA